MSNQIWIILYSILIAEFVCFVSLLFLMLNRFGYKIIYNEDERTITRKGFICGYKYIIKIEDINDIVIETFPKDYIKRENNNIVFVKKIIEKSIEKRKIVTLEKSKVIDYYIDKQKLIIVTKEQNYIIEDFHVKFSKIEQLFN